MNLRCRQRPNDDRMMRSCRCIVNEMDFRMSGGGERLSPRTTMFTKQSVLLRLFQARSSRATTGIGGRQTKITLQPQHEQLDAGRAKVDDAVGDLLIAAEQPGRGAAIAAVIGTRTNKSRKEILAAFGQRGTSKTSRRNNNWNGRCAPAVPARCPTRQSPRMIILARHRSRRHTRNDNLYFLGTSSIGTCSDLEYLSFRIRPRFYVLDHERYASSARERKGILA
ncbi:hypothetical protein [Bradyrhizobium sp. SRS-191]|uniref:hypothetical protein n=1 Tax=Bradyrhizobium sp. SRS-191 TaxID=2962606 RepID=UPI00211E0281|nr:hypothetical protein [Bradyrhizobium sp. SRS-191]